LMGAMFGVAIVFLHNYLFTGLALQSSALMKSHWMKGEINFYPLFLGGVGLLFLLLIPIFAGKLTKMIQVSDMQSLLALSAFLAWVGYGIFYSKNSDIQPWYSANILFSIFIFFCALWISIQHGRMENFQLMPHILFALIFAFAFLQTAFRTYPVNERNSEWIHQQAFLEAGKYLHDHPLDGKIGAWNAGIVNYYQGGEVVNLDGLVNNDIYAYAIKDSSFDYLQKVNVRYIIDFDIMFRKDVIERSGYDDPRLLENLLPVKKFGKYPVAGNLILYEIMELK